MSARVEETRDADPWPTMTVLGTRVHLVDNSEVLSCMERWIEERERCHFVVNTGFHGLWEGHRDPEFRRVVNECDLLSPDGIAPVLLARIRRLPLAKRATSAELMRMFLRASRGEGLSKLLLR